MSLTDEQIKELGALISRLANLTYMEASYGRNEPLAADRCYEEARHVAARIRELGVPFDDIPDPGEE